MPFMSGFKKAPIYVLEYSQYILSRRRPHQSVIQISNLYILMMFYQCQWLIARGNAEHFPDRDQAAIPSEAQD